MSDQPKVSPKGKTPKELATELGCDQKLLRRIMRSMTELESQPGQGGRWEIPAQFEAELRERVSRTHNRKVAQFVPKGAKKV